MSWWAPVETVEDYQLESSYFWKEIEKEARLERRLIEEKEAAERREEWKRQQRQKRLEKSILDEQKAYLKRNRPKRTK